MNKSIYKNWVRCHICNKSFEKDEFWGVEIHLENEHDLDDWVIDYGEYKSCPDLEESYELFESDVEDVNWLMII